MNVAISATIHEGLGSKIPSKMPGSNLSKNESWQPRRIYSQATVVRSCTKLYYSSDLFLTCGIKWGINFVSNVMAITQNVGELVLYWAKVQMI